MRFGSLLSDFNIPQGNINYAKVSEGDRITWENHDFIPHTATASDGSFDSDVVSPGESFSIITKGQGVIVAYFCEIHPWMQGVVAIS